MAHLLFTVFLLCYPSYGNILSRRSFIGNTIGMSLINKPNIVNANDDEEPGLIRGLNNNLYYSGPLTDTTIFSITSNLIALQQQSDINEINLHMQSSGGSLLPSLALVDLIRVSDIPINTYIDGYCASAASLITVVGAQRFINKHGVILIHQLKMGIEPSKYLELKDQSVNADTLMDIIKQIYLENTNLNPLKLDELLMHDWWLNSTLCKKYGIIDFIV
jgi:ATP-dependent protease ClpP protease subunit